MEHNEHFEQLIALLESQLPRPVDQQPGPDNSILFTGGRPPEVVVHLTQSTVSVSEYAGAWDTTGHFLPKPRRVGIVHWRRLHETAMMGALLALIKGARETRQSRYRPCSVCGEMNPPEWLFEDDVCHSCLNHRGHVVH